MQANGKVLWVTAPTLSRYVQQCLDVQCAMLGGHSAFSKVSALRQTCVRARRRNACQNNTGSSSCTQQADSCMQWLSDLCVVLDSEALLNVNYSSHTAVAGQFSLQQPYQAKQQSTHPAANSSVQAAPSDCSPGQTVDDTTGDSVSLDPACAVNEQCPVSLPSRSRKRKRALPDPQRILRQQEANARHETRQPILLSAYQLLQQHLESGHSLCSVKPPELHAAKEPLRGQEQIDDTSTAAEAFDLRALHELKHVLHPKFQFSDSASPDHGEPAVNLFDTISSNRHDVERLASAYDTEVLIPAHASFLMSTVKRLQPLLSGEGYHCIVLDPPWENKSAKRGSKYPTLPSRNLMGIPLQRLMHQDGCLVGLWVTNRERHLRFVHDELLPHWGLSLHATWYWLKVTCTGQLVSPLDVSHRRPYEVLLLLHPFHSRRASAAELDMPSQHHTAAVVETPCRSSSHSRAGTMQGCRTGHDRPSDGLVMIAVPGEHSRKPKLGQLLQPFLPASPCCLEMFARELTAGWTSWGNEALHFQQLNCFFCTS